MQLLEMTWQQVNALDRSTLVVAPFGALEQHGPHLPMETDALIGREIARRLDAAFYGRLLVLPTQWLGLSTHHLSFAGTVSASIESYFAMATETLASLANAGFSKFLVLNSHGGNTSILDVVLTRCRDRFPDVRMVGVTYWNAAAESLKELRESELGGMGHAGELETSLVLATRPELVHMDLAVAGGKWPTSAFLAKDMLRGGSASVSPTFAELSDIGTVGDPRSATAEKGERFYAAIVVTLSKLVREIQDNSIDEFEIVGSQRPRAE